MTRPPFHADQVGSLLRPPELREARSAKVSPEELKEVEDRCIARAVKRQEEIGLQSITDGEFRRDFWHLDFLKQLDGIELKPVSGMTFNAALKDKPADLAVTMHTCRGNFRSTWFAAGGYQDEVVRAMFSANVDGFFMEYDSERAGGFEPLRLLPKGKKLVLGLVTTKSGALEPKDALKRRIDEAAKQVPLENLCLSPQCGFSSTHHGNLLTEDEQWRKLARVVEVAQEVWH